MSTIRHLIKQIRALPYNDMMLIAEELHTRINDATKQKVEASVLAGILSRIQEGNVDPDDQAKEEEKVLQSVFRRKTSMLIQRHSSGKGWVVSCGTIPGAHAVNPELRAAITMLFDQCITLHVLQK